MVLSQEELDSLMERIQKDLADAYATGDAEKVVAFYDQHSVIIKTGADPKAWLGKDEITKFYNFIMAGPNKKPKMIVEKNFSTANDDYIIHRGKFEANNFSFYPYEQIWHKQKNGNYLIAREQFER